MNVECSTLEVGKFVPHANKSKLIYNTSRILWEAREGERERDREKQRQSTSLIACMGQGAL